MEEQNNFNQSRESFDENALLTKELLLKRDYINELRQKFHALMEENRFLKGDLDGQEADE